MAQRVPTINITKPMKNNQVIPHHLSHSTSDISSLVLMSEGRGFNYPLTRGLCNICITISASAVHFSLAHNVSGHKR